MDRLDLLTQAQKEFSARGLSVHTVNSKEELIKDFETNKATHNPSGDLEITVVNIQKFPQDIKFSNENFYNIKTQRIYFLDEVHRSYDPKGSFLANLLESDRQAILIGLTGTPLIKDDRKSRELFGDYIHKYYYNSSIADGYTLKLIREGIETTYKTKLDKILSELEIRKGGIDKKNIFAHPKFVEPMLSYIIDDFERSRRIYGDDSIGAMVVCESSEQAIKLFEIFEKTYTKKFKASLILDKIEDKDSKKDRVEEFKQGKIDFLFVYLMLLTGFDAPRLKKLYLARLIKDHNLLQTLTRVNRPYKKFRYGYVVDFADIRKEFDATNRAYFEELQLELGDQFQNYSDILLSQEEIEKEIQNIKNTLSHFDILNAENFRKQIDEINDKQKILELKKALDTARELYNKIRYMGNDEALAKMDFEKLVVLYKEVEARLRFLNLKELIENKEDNTKLLNLALEEISFSF